jgi:hypothetical protein
VNLEAVAGVIVSSKYISSAECLKIGSVFCRNLVQIYYLSIGKVLQGNFEGRNGDRIYSKLLRDATKVLWEALGAKQTV